MAKSVDFFRHDLGKAELESVAETLDSVFLTLGPRVGEFERRFAEYLDAPCAVGLSSCTAGLILLLRAFGIGPGDEVLLPPMTFVATANAILHVGATPVFVDVDAHSGLIDPEAVERAIGERTKAIICVHLYGQLCDMPSLRQIADRHSLRLIEDSAHAVEARRDAVRPGSHGDAAAFSFYATKVLTCGDGGAVVVHDETVAARIRLLRNQGVTKDAASRYGQSYTHWDMVEPGYKAALTDLQAALLLPQLSRLDERRRKREALVERYEERLSGRPDIDVIHRSGVSSHHLFTALVPRDARDAVLAGLCERGIGCAVNYRAIHTLSWFRDNLGCAPSDFPNAEEIGERTVSLPLWPEMPIEDVDVVVDALVDTLDA